MNEAVTTLELYETLRDKLGDEATKRFIAYVDERIKRETVTKGDLREETARIREEMAKMEGRLIRWMFLFWVGQVAAMLGILAFVLRS